MMTLTLLKCCNMLESSEQSIVTPLLGLKSQDLHQVCIVPQDFTLYHHSEHYSLKLNSSKLFSLRSFPLRVMRVTGWSWRVSVAQIMFWQLTILTTSFVVRHNYAFTAHSKIISVSINIIHFTLILQRRKKTTPIYYPDYNQCNVLVLGAQSVTSSLHGGL